MDSQFTDRNRRWSGCTIAVLIVTVVGVIGIVGLGAVGMLVYQAIQEEGLFEVTPDPDAPLEVLPTLDVKLDAPGWVKPGEEFDVVLLTRNLEPENRIELYSVDVDLAFLQGFEVLSIEPSPEGTESLDEWNQRRWLFQTPVEPGDSLSVTFRLRAVQVGHYIGDIDVCNRSIQYTTVRPNIDVTVEAQP